jgi:phosphate transport system permease protein
MPPAPAARFDTQLGRRRRWKNMISQAEALPWGFRSRETQASSRLFTSLTCAAAFLILAILMAILGNIAFQGAPGLSLRFITTGAQLNTFDVAQAGVLPMIVGTAARVMLMTLFVMPIGVITAIYLNEYAPATAWFTRVTRGAVNNLAGVPSIVFGLFGLGFFVNFVGHHLDDWLRPGAAGPLWGQPALVWASLTLAVMTLPVVIVATEEALRSTLPGLREASFALGASKLQTIVKVILPQALPGILTGGILAVSRAAGEVAPILLTGAASYMATLPGSLTDQFMDLGYHIFTLSTQSPNIEKTRPLLFATALVLLLLTFSLNLAAMILRARLRRDLRAVH